MAHVYLTGYTPYPALPGGDPRLPYIAQKLTRQIHKTALGTETMMPWTHLEDVSACMAALRSDGYTVVALEQTETSILLPQFNPPTNIALLLGREVEGIDTELLKHCDMSVEIPMLGKKESFNVVQAAAMALYHCRFRAAS